MSKPLPLLRHFRKLKDPRINRRKLHSLEAILVIAICAVIAGANDFQQIALFAQKRKDWLGRFLELPNGVPSHDTFERVFARLDPLRFQECFATWMNAWYAQLTGKHLAIDGKAVCGSASPRKGLRCLHLVNVWATQANLCLGLVACDADSNEITAIPKLLDLLDLEGALVTIDAAGCQKKIAEQVVDGGGDYLLVVKENQGKLYEEIQACFERAAEQDWRGVTNSYYEKDDRGHGRQENRCCLVIEDPEGMTEKENWPKLNVIGMCQSMRTEADGKSSFHVRYFIGSKRAKARYYGKSLRGHWRVENNLHWQLDVTFREDDSRVRQRTAATNLAVVRRLALNLTKQEGTQMSIAKKRFAAALDTDYLEEILEMHDNR
ncbi:MAG TPA: ISAs1 family transposase [Gemmataceae bacterium]|nr:ISAs1 family transposase [Gemmataceae bacterium]